MMVDPFISSVEFRSQPADTIVVYCSDGRARRQVAEFMDKQGIEADVYAVPGGPLALAGGVETFQDGMVAEKGLEFLAEHHGTRRIILIAHGGEEDSCQCGMAKKLWPALSPPERVKRQKDALLRAAERLTSAVSLPVECYFANVISGMVQFEKVG